MNTYVEPPTLSQIKHSRFICFSTIDTDADNDSIPDTDEGGGDADSDSVADNVDTDSDNDSILDADEGFGDAVPDASVLDPVVFRARGEAAPSSRNTSTTMYCVGREDKTACSQCRLTQA